MDKKRIKLRQIDIVYFSGTGNTKMVAETFFDKFNEKKKNVTINELRYNKKVFPMGNMLIIIYPVYACNAPPLIYEWLNDIPDVVNCEAVIISVSGGGEISPNTACRMRSIKLLEQKGYHVIYENMIVMPSNIFVSTGTELSIRLLNILPVKVNKMTDEILGKIKRLVKPKLIDIVISCIFLFFKSGSKKFGKNITITSDCNGCGWCVKNCPKGNIKMNNGRPYYLNLCTVCMGCVYGCPKRALKPKKLKSFVLNDGYNLNALKKLSSKESKDSIEELAKGYLFKGIRNYLLDK